MTERHPQPHVPRRPKPSAPRGPVVVAYSWRRWRGLLALAVIVSVAGNTAHAVLMAPTVYGWGAAIAASVAPAFLFWITHNMITAPGGSRGWRNDRIGATVVAAVAFGAFTVSFLTLRDLMLAFGFSPTVAAILPLVVDVTIAGASRELVREAEVAAHLPSAVRGPGDSVVAPATSAAAGGLISVGGEATSQVNAVDGGVAAVVAAQPALHLVTADVEQVGHLPAAERLVAAGTVRGPAEPVAVAMAALAAGRSQRAAATVSGLHRTTVARLKSEVSPR